MAKCTSIVVGTGGMARHHIRMMLDQAETTEVVGFVEVSDDSVKAVREIYKERELECPPFYQTIAELVEAQGAPDASFVCTPHKFHFENACDCMEAGMDVCMEKPMVLNADEAERLIESRDRTGRLFVVAFPGSLSPAVKKAKQMISDREIGEVTGIAAFAHQHWKQATTGKWRQVPEISGGGFLFDT